MRTIFAGVTFENNNDTTATLERLRLLIGCQKLLNQRETEIQQLLHQQDNPEFTIMLEELAEDKAMLQAETKRHF